MFFVLECGILFMNKNNLYLYYWGRNEVCCRVSGVLEGRLKLYSECLEY